MPADGKVVQVASRLVKHAREVKRLFWFRNSPSTYSTGDQRTKTVLSSPHASLIPRKTSRVSFALFSSEPPYWSVPIIRRSDKSDSDSTDSRPHIHTGESGLLQKNGAVMIWRLNSSISSSVIRVYGGSRHDFSLGP